MNPVAVFLVFLRLGLTSFGGPVAHLGYFRTEFVTNRQWLSETTYADLVGLCQFLPGATSSQVGMAIGLQRAGLAGAVAAWLGFTLPSAVVMALLGYAVLQYGEFLDARWLLALKAVAIVVVAKAIWGMGKHLCPDVSRKAIAVVAALLASAAPFAWGQMLAIAAGAIAGLWLVNDYGTTPSSPDAQRVPRWLGACLLAAFASLIVLLPFVSMQFERFYRTGALVFGGGHVVLPLLHAEVVTRGWVTQDLFMAGYGLAQAMPGPLFTFAAYLGALSTGGPGGALGALSCLIAIFLPSFLLVVGVMPFWESLRRHQSMQRALRGINAAVVGLLIASLISVLWSTSA